MTAVRTQQAGSPRVASTTPTHPPPTGSPNQTSRPGSGCAGSWNSIKQASGGTCDTSAPTPAEADDLTQETFLAVARTGFAGVESNTGRDRAGFEERGEHQTAGYLRTAARNQLLMLRRRQNRQISTVEIEAAEGVWAATTVDHGWDALLDSLAECLGQLEGRPRRAIDLQYRDDAGRAEIAQQLDMKPDGVKTLLRRTRQLLRECLERSRNAGERSP